MAKRKPKARTFDNATGQTLGDGASGSWGSEADVDRQWFPASDPSFLETVVPADTPYPTDIIGLSIMKGSPDPMHDTWIAPTSAAITAGRVQAATDTIVATGDQIANAGGAIFDAATMIAKNFVPILAGIAALYLLFQWEKIK